MSVNLNDLGKYLSEESFEERKPANGKSYEKPVIMPTARVVRAKPVSNEAGLKKDSKQNKRRTIPLNKSPEINFQSFETSESEDTVKLVQNEITKEVTIKANLKKRISLPANLESEMKDMMTPSMESKHRQELTRGIRDLSNIFLHQPTTLKDIEPPVQLATDLMAHQKEALSWMKWCEMSNFGPAGGILADDMGLGKTLSTIALILIRSSKGVPCNTLVICPAGVIHHWQSELDKHCKPDKRLAIKIYHGLKRDGNDLNKTDVVITSYGIVAKEQGNDNKSSPLYSHEWTRIILDEAHYIKNPSTKTARGVFGLKSQYRWALSGSLIHKELKSIHSIIRYLKYSPFDDTNLWTAWIKSDKGKSAKRVNTLIKGILLRRTKDDRKKNGQLKVALPLREELSHPLTLSPFEEKVYNSIEAIVKKITADLPKKMGRGNTVFFVMFQRLQHCCDHVSLLNAMKSNTPKSNMDKGLTTMLKSMRIDDGLKQNNGSNKSSSESDVEINEYNDDYDNDDYEEYDDDEDDEIGQVPLDSSSELQESNGTGDNNDKENEKELNETSSESEDTEELVNDSGSDFDVSFESTKIQELLQLIDEKVIANGDKCVVTSQWNGMLKIIGFHLQKNNIKYYTIHGNVVIAKRTEIINDLNTNFERDAVAVLLISLKVGGTGINLIGANHVFLVDPHWDPFYDRQVSDRIYRLGQQKTVFIHRLVTMGTIEQRIEELRKKKRNLLDNVVDRQKSPNPQNPTISELKELLFSDDLDDLASDDLPE